MSVFADHLKKVLKFLEQYQSLVDSHLVDFITRDLWSECLPREFQMELENLCSDIIVVENNLPSIVMNGEETPELDKFFTEIDSLSLEKCNSVYKVIDLPALFKTWGFPVDDDGLDFENVGKEKHEFMNKKKSHEVEILSKVTSSLAKFYSNVIIDAGAGKGYLSEFISQKYKIPVLAIDSSDVNHKGAIKRQSIMGKRNRQNSTSVRHLVKWIDDDTDFKNLSETYFPDESLDRGLTITGLHTCGSLGHSVIKSFLNKDCVKSLCVVTCCYHLCDTSMSGRLNFSKSAKMLAQQSVERMNNNNNNKNSLFSPTLYYRAVIQVLLNSLGLQDVRIGRGAPVDNFVNYAKWALKKIGINATEIPEESILEELYNSHKRFKSKMEIFQILRIRLGSIIESAILLDRIIFLESSKVCSNFALVKLFDPIISPRCYGIIATK